MTDVKRCLSCGKGIVYKTDFCQFCSQYLRLKREIEDEILFLIDHADDFTRSDLQGCVAGIVNKYFIKHS